MAEKSARRLHKQMGMIPSEQLPRVVVDKVKEYGKMIRENRLDGFDSSNLDTY